ncbi:hypothetical protein AB0L65_31290 [Nonomuraea sp. NPDC052116]|uniref:hypothetical protein n=1 Tax=Nonomuraea sp. NPDC052116 TaxID=3155665 RepID=UPI003433DB58
MAQSQFSHYFVAGMALCVVRRRRVRRQGRRSHTEIASGVVATVIIAMTLVALRVTRGLGRPRFVIAGALTYPLHLVHAYAGFIAFTRLGDPAPPYGTMALTGALAYAIHTLVERPPTPAPKRASTPGGNGAAIPHR